MAKIFNYKKDQKISPEEEASIQNKLWKSKTSGPDGNPLPDMPDMSDDDGAELDETDIDPNTHKENFPGSAREAAAANIDIRKYKDPAGLTVAKMAVGMWFTQYRKFMISLVYGFFILVSVITWGLFFYTFGHYILFGMKADEILINDLVNTRLVGRSYFLDRRPKDIQISVSELIQLSSDKADVYAKIANPNQKHWVNFRYHYVSGENEFGHAANFLLPGENKYLLTLNQDADLARPGARLVFDEIKWSRVNAHKYPDWDRYYRDHLNIKIEDVEFIPAKSTVLTEKMRLNELHFRMFNDTAFNYWKVSFNIIIYSGNKIVGVNRYTANNLMSGERRDIEITWPGVFGHINDVLIMPELNITRDDIYIRFEGDEGDLLTGEEHLNSR